MIPAFVNQLGNTSNKTAGTTLALTTGFTTTAGNLIVARVLFDNFTTASKPIVSSITKMAGETNNWVFLGAARSTSTSAGAFSSGEMWCIQTTVAWAAAAYTVTLDSSVTQKAMLFTEYSGTQAVVRSTTGTAYSTTTTAASAVTTGTAPVVNDLALGLIFGSNVAAAQAGSNNTTGGSWNSAGGFGSTGGSGTTNNYGIGQHKILNAASHLTYANSAAMTAGNGAIIAVLQSIADPSITQAAYQFFDDTGTESGAAPLASQDTAVTGNPSTGDGYGQIRVRLQSTTAVAVQATDDFTLQWEKNASGTWNVVGAVLASSNTTIGGGTVQLGGSNAWTLVGQSFLGNGNPLSRASFFMNKVGTPAVNLTAKLYAHTGTYGTTAGIPTGSALAVSTTTVPTASLTGSNVWYYFDFDRTFTLANGTPYCICVETPLVDSGNYVRVGSSTDVHGGSPSYFTSGSWTGLVAADLGFEVYTESNTVTSFDSPTLTESAATTNRLTGGTGTFTPGKVSEVGNVTNVGWSGNNYTEILFSVRLIAAQLANGDTLRFRVLRNGSTANMTYAVTPTINLVTTPPVDLVVDSCSHTVVSQQPAEVYLKPSLGFASTPDPPVIPNGYVLAMKTRGPQSLSPSGNVLASQNVADGRRSFWAERRGDDGSLSLQASATGNYPASNLGYSAGTSTVSRNWAEVLALTGAYNGVFDTYRSTNDGLTWAHIGGWNFGVVSAPFDSADPLLIGADGTGTTGKWDDRIYWMELRTGTTPGAGTLLWRFDAADWVSGTSWTGAADGRVWTLSSASAIVQQPAVSDITIIETPAINLVVNNAQHNFIHEDGAWISSVSRTSLITTPDPGLLPNQFVVVAKMEGPAVISPYGGSNSYPLVGQWDRSAGNNSWGVGRYGPTHSQRPGGFNWAFSATGTQTASTSASGTIGTASQVTGGREYHAYPVTLNNGSNQAVFRDLVSTDAGATWTPASADVIVTPAGVIPFDSTATLNVGGLQYGGFMNFWDGRISWVELRTGTDPKAGTLLWRCDPEEYVKTPETNLRIPGVSTSVLRTPDSASFALTDLDVSWFGSLDTVSTNDQALIGQWGISGQRSWSLRFGYVTGNRFLRLYHSADGVASTVNADNSTPIAWLDNGAFFGARVTRRQSDGVTRFYMSVDDPPTWKLLGEVVIAAGVALFDSPAYLMVGGISTTGTATSNHSTGYFRRAEVRNGFDGAGSVVASPNATVVPDTATSFSDGPGNLWTVANTADLIPSLISSWIDVRGRTWTASKPAGIIKPTPDVPTIEHVVPAVVTPDNCFHTVVSQQPAEHYITQLSADSCSTPDFGAMPATFTITAKVRGGPNGSTGVSGIASQFGSGDSSWSFGRTGTTGAVGLTYSSSGANSIQTTAGNLYPHPYTTDYIGVAYYGTGTNDQKFIRSTDYGATWPIIDQGGSAITLRESAVAVIIGDTPGQATFQGQIFWVEMRSGTDPLGGTLLWRFDAADHVSGTTWTGAADGRTWTISSAGLITHIPVASDVTITEIPATNFVVQDAQHIFPNQTDMSPWLAPLVGRATTPDPGPLPVGGFVFVIKARGPQSASLGISLIPVSQNRADPTRSFRVKRGAVNGLLSLTAYPTGSNASLVESINGVSGPLTLDLLNPDYWALAYNSTTGAYRSLYSTDKGATYIQRLANTDASPDVFFDSSDIMTIGADGTGSTSIWDDRIYWIELRTGDDPKAGTLLWRFDASEWVSGTGWTDARGNVWTLSAAGAVVRPGPTEPTIEVQVAPTLANADSYHTVDSSTPAFTQNHVLVVDNAAHAIVSDSPPLTQVHILTVANAAHTEVSDSPGITQVHILTVAGAAHAQAVEHVAINIATNVPPADAAHAILSDSPAFTQVHVLVVANAAHAVTSEVPSLTQVHILTVASAAQAQVSDSPPITQLHILVAQSAAHAQAAANVDTTQVHILTVQSAAHTIFSDDLGLSTEGVVAGADCYNSVTSGTPSLTQVHNLTVQNALHVHTATTVSIVYNVNLPGVDNAAHAQSAGVVTLIIDIPVVGAAHAVTSSSPFIIVDIPILNAAQAVTSSTVAITQVHNLVVANADHAHSVTSDVPLTQIHKLTVDSAVHAQVAVEVSFTQDHFLAAVASAFHAHSVDQNLDLTQEHNISVASALHTHTAEGELVMEIIVWLVVDSAHHELKGPEVNLAGIILLNEALALYLGTQAVRAMYVGASKVWP